MHCPPAIWRMQTREPEHHPERKRNVIFQTSIFKFHMILVLCWNLKSVGISPTAKLANEILVSNSIGALAVGGYHPGNCPISLTVWHFLSRWFSKLPVWWDMDEPFPGGVSPKLTSPPKTNGWNRINTALKKEKHLQTPILGFKAVRRLGCCASFTVRWRFFCEEGSCGWRLDSARCPFGAQLGESPQLSIFVWDHLSVRNARFFFVC